MLKLIKTWLDTLPWGLVTIICLSLGLAPFSPPHVVEKIRMLLDGSLIQPIDWFDLAPTRKSLAPSDRQDDQRRNSVSGSGNHRIDHSTAASLTFSPIFYCEAGND